MLIQQADRNTMGPINAKDQDRTRLSQPFG
jgi:hypothetical protein